MRYKFNHHQHCYVWITTNSYTSTVIINLPPLVLLTRLDEAAVALQKEKNMYKEIENFPMCFKVSPCVV